MKAAGFSEQGHEKNWQSAVLKKMETRGHIRNFLESLEI